MSPCILFFNTTLIFLCLVIRIPVLISCVSVWCPTNEVSQSQDNVRAWSVLPPTPPTGTEVALPCTVHLISSMPSIINEVRKVCSSNSSSTAFSTANQLNLPIGNRPLQVRRYHLKFLISLSSFKTTPAWMTLPVPTVPPIQLPEH